MDSHLLHLWKAKAGHEQRWQGQRWNTTLRRRLTQLKKEIETHAAALAKIRNSTWNLFRHLIDSTQSKTHQKQIMTKLIHASQASPQELLRTLRELHFPEPAFPSYIRSRRAYAFPYLPLKQKEREHIKALLKSCTKVALSLSPSTSAARLLNLGTHNSFEELAEATLTAQFTRLSGTAIGRTLLCQLGIAPITHSTEVAPLPPDLYSHLVIPPIQKNMHPEHDGKRRAARAKALYKQYGEPIIVTDSSETAEEAATALALISTSSTKILSDSISAVSNFGKHLLSGTTARLLRFWHPTCPVTLIWTPTHAGCSGNEEVHFLARGVTFRAEVGPPPPALEHLLTFRDILTHYRDTRLSGLTEGQRNAQPKGDNAAPPPQRMPSCDALSPRRATYHRPLYAPPALSLILTQASHWRRLQTRTPPYPILLHARYPDEFLSSCKLGGKPGDFLHVLLTCPTFPHAPSQTTAESCWETLLASSTATDQRLIIAAALKRIALQGLSIGL
ncbi:hypothetical protein HPB49_011949 [Dermacentor silvarum]|uniref:Uncharacterized protein n=1 Tax=Dermacentor silvarum TaxID=543639 RepID=A0ACB8DCA9_DERSI|nr:hypothetical protein HPB49_011949 [Dermacentor silvarum]